MRINYLCQRLLLKSFRSAHDFDCIRNCFEKSVEVGDVRMVDRFKVNKMNKYGFFFFFRLFLCLNELFLHLFKVYFGIGT